ncbi:S1C family serine protease [Dysosmobacter sp.]|uniref:S1C family serine protease n=1 Tax=Dysosmobacter sp. TaxID=2591382 RepID=UPI002A9A0C78|nr:trypsin-like peptidase domain-containing protein [Dysosmobacter sp.]MDY5612232.1 trypsin-like peptidase domain-containing protein [Dysosmobacter sp.]
MEERDTREIVEVYRRPDPREVVEVYSRPLPGSEQPAPAPVKRKSRKGLWIFLACLAVIVLLAVAGRLLAGWLAPPADDRFEWDPAEERKTENSGGITIPAIPAGQGVQFCLTRDHGAVLPAQEIYRQVNPSVVTVMANLGESMSVGTGVIFTEDGYVVTNYHVLEGGSECMISLDTGEMYEARYAAGDAANDLAVLKIDGQVLPAAEFGDSDLLTVGDKVYAIGNPLGVELRGTLTDGIVSAINRDVWVDNRTMTLIQTNAALNSGNSGGPLINEYGQVVGINVIKMTSRYSNVEGLGFAIPTASMERIVNDLLTYGEIQPEPLLGISVMRTAEEAAAGVRGLRVDSVTPDGAGALAGIREGDFILAADGDAMTTSQDLLRVRRRFYVGDSMDMTIWRDGEILEVTLELKDAVEEEPETAPWYAE